MGSKIDKRTKSHLNRNRLHGKSLAIYNGIPRNWHTLWKITRTGKNRESDDVDDWRRVVSLRINE